MKSLREVIGNRLFHKICAVGICAVWVLGHLGKSAAAEPIVDIVAKKGFVNVEDWYKINDELIFCVQLKNKKWAFWNPQGDSLAYTNRLDCTAKYKMPNRVSTFVNKLRVDHHTLEVLDAFDPDSGAITIANNNRIFAREDYTIGCHTNFDLYYQITTPDGQSIKFYIILKNGKTKVNSYRCDAFEYEFQQSYDVQYIGAFFIKKMTFFSAARDEPGGFIPLLLIFDSLPFDGWTSHDGIYIIPYEKLHNRLMRLDYYDYAGRYREVLETIKEMDK